MRRVIIGTIVLFIFSTGNLFAQLQGQAKIDSLLKELPLQKEDTNKVKVLKDLSFGYVSISSDEGIKYGQQGVELATKLAWKKGIAIANQGIGNNCYNKSDCPKTLEYFDKALKLFEEIGYKKGIASVTGNIALVYRALSDYPKALEYNFKALKIAREIGDKNTIANTAANIGNVYQSEADYPKALEYHFKALKMAEEAGNKNLTAGVTCNIGIVYESLSDYPKALEYYFKALKMDEETGNKQYAATVTSNIGNVYKSQKDHLKALEYDFKALKMAEEMGDKRLAASVTGNIGAVYIDQKNYAMAITYSQSALKMDEEIAYKYDAAIQLHNIGACYLDLVMDTTVKSGLIAQSGEIHKGTYLPGTVDIPSDKATRLRKAVDYLQRGLAVSREISVLEIMQKCYDGLAKAYQLTGDYKKALDASGNFHAIKDSVFSKENNEAIVKMGMKDEYERQHLADSLKTTEKEKIAAINLQKQKSYTTLGIAGILLLAGFSFFIVKERGKSETERKKSDGLLLNILPTEVAEELKATGTTTAKHYNNVTVLFTDFVNFTQAAELLNPQSLIDELHTCFKMFDEITAKYNIEKIKTIGDAYLAVCGLPSPDPKHAENVVRAAVEINSFMANRLAKLGSDRTFAVRIGIHSGSVVAGIVGVKKFAYDIWGDTVNTAARMEQNSEAGKINISETTYNLVKDKFSCEYRGEVEAKGKGVMKMYFVS